MKTPFLAFLCLMMCSPAFSQNSAAAFLPETFVNWKAVLSNKIVKLGWTTTVEKNYVHFLVERSANGSDFREVSRVSATGNSDKASDYSYSDPLDPQNGIVYYRVKCIDLNGSVKQSEIRMVRVETGVNTLSMSFYPNPVVDALRISLPATWENQKVTFEVYNSNGVFIKQTIKNMADQTETVRVNDLGEGIYFIKVSSTLGSGMQRVIKVR